MACSGLCVFDLLLDRSLRFLPLPSFEVAWPPPHGMVCSGTRFSIDMGSEQLRDAIERQQVKRRRATSAAKASKGQANGSFPVVLCPVGFAKGRESRCRSDEIYNSGRGINSLGHVGPSAANPAPASTLASGSVCVMVWCDSYIVQSEGNHAVVGLDIHRMRREGSTTYIHIYMQPALISHNQRPAATPGKP